MKRIPTNYAVTREQKRYIVRQQMRKNKVGHPCKKEIVNIGEKPSSFFSRNWRNYLEEDA